MVDVEKVLATLDITLTAQRGSEVQGLCPMHKERTGNEDHNPSWWINSVTGAHICFSCGYKGNIYTLVRDIKGIDYFDAKDYVEQNIEVDVNVLLRRIRELPQYISTEEEIGMSEARLVVYTDVPDNELKKRFLVRTAVDHYGVRWDKEHNAWIVPIRDPDTFALWGWQEKGANGRFFRNQPVGVKKSKTVFGVQHQSKKATVVVESPLDVVRLHSAGVSGAISTFGALLSEEQAKIMRRSELVIAAFDNDEAGKKACEQILGFARKYGMELKFFNYDGIDVKDVGDMTVEEIYRGLATARDRVWGKAAYGA